MSILHYQEEQLYVEQVALQTIANQYGTPCYIYSRASIEDNWQRFSKPLQKLKHQISYAVKANSNIAIINLLASLGAGFDIVSQGELERVIKAGGKPNKTVFSGVGKQTTEIARAMDCGIQCFNVESPQEIERLHALAIQGNKTINIAFRLNPDVDAKTHPYISTGLKENKFGLSTDHLIELCQLVEPPLKLTGLAMHIGSQITELEPFANAIERLLHYYEEVTQKGFDISHLDIGGGLGIAYQVDTPASIESYTDLIVQYFQDLPVSVFLEPGRALVGPAGVLLTGIEYLKTTPEKNFAVVNAGMNDLLRPALYQGWHDILPVAKKSILDKTYDVVGPVCETADFLGKNRKLAIEQGDLLAIDSVGAYGFSMSSNYNSRCRPAEILIDGSNIHLIRQRESFSDLTLGEKIPLLTAQA